MYPPAFLGQVEGSSWSLAGHTHPQTSQEWAPSAPPILGASSTAATSGVPEKPFRVPLSGPKWFEASWAVGGGTPPLSLGPREAN